MTEGKRYDRQLAFLRAIANFENSDRSINSIGREIFSTDRNVYLVLNKFLEEGLITMNKGKKFLIVKITLKGKRLILKTF